MWKIYKLIDLDKLKIDIKIPSIIFIYGDLWAWKTTISKHIINDLFWYKWDVTSPTYTYYNKYLVNNYKCKYIPNCHPEFITLYHFDLYRLKNYDEFFAIWWEEVFDNNNWIILVEWPEILEGYYKPDIIIKMKKTDNDDEREIEIVKY
jgi:tRNA threonylcarbamoyladenosine biosynthesis protein TsaE